MYCKNCGRPLNDNQAICVACGTEVGQGNACCVNCGAPLSDVGQAKCSNCGFEDQSKVRYKSLSAILQIILSILGTVLLFVNGFLNYYLINFTNTENINVFRPIASLSVADCTGTVILVLLILLTLAPGVISVIGGTSKSNACGWASAVVAFASSSLLGVIYGCAYFKIFWSYNLASQDAGFTMMPGLVFYIIAALYTAKVVLGLLDGIGRPLFKRKITN